MWIVFLLLADNSCAKEWMKSFSQSPLPSSFMSFSMIYWILFYFLLCAEFATSKSVEPRTQPLKLLSTANRIGQTCWQYLGPQWMLGPLWSRWIWARSAAPDDLCLLPCHDCSCSMQKSTCCEVKPHSLSCQACFPEIIWLLILFHFDNCNSHFTLLFCFRTVVLKVRPSSVVYKSPMRTALSSIHTP